MYHPYVNQQGVNTQCQLHSTMYITFSIIKPVATMVKHNGIITKTSRSNIHSQKDVLKLLQFVTNVQSNTTRKAKKGANVDHVGQSTGTMPSIDATLSISIENDMTSNQKQTNICIRYREYLNNITTNTEVYDGQAQTTVVSLNESSKLHLKRR
eukprot:TRINITY_DN3134_c2_g1_i1.p2 TRINITY_DN3134_c2_g1~~TRINITY_DN3134_c2_g1_i1.p2  ORF type:complete len:154 (-),score=12.14 TRINITY_DN3134_c2_g1_i1:309-770(-)